MGSGGVLLKRTSPQQPQRGPLGNLDQRCSKSMRIRAVWSPVAARMSPQPHPPTQHTHTHTPDVTLAAPPCQAAARRWAGPRGPRRKSLQGRRQGAEE